MPKIVNKEEKKAKILEASIRVFSKKGLNNTKISDIAEYAAIGKGTIYEYFKSKDEIFTASFSFHIEKFEENISRRLFRIKDPLKKLYAYFSAWSELFEGDHLEYLEIVLDFWAEGVRQRDDSLMINLDRIYSENRDMLDDLLYDCVTKGEIKKVKVEGKRAKRINAIAASTIEGIQAPFLYEGSCNGDLFIQYVETVLCPILKPGQVVIMDNASFHKSQKVKELIESKHCRLIYLPPYSPEYNPIEHYWAILKKAIKKIRKKIVDVWESVSLAIELTQKFRQC